MAIGIPEMWSPFSTPQRAYPEGVMSGQPGWGNFLNWMGGVGLGGQNWGGAGGGAGMINTLQPGQQGILNSGSNFINSLFGGQGGWNPFMPMSPQGTADWWNQFMRPAAESQFTQKTLPAVKEAYVGPGTYWSGARANAESGARQDFENQQSQQIGSYFQHSRDVANQSLLPFALGLLNANTGIATGQQQQQGAGGLGGLGEYLMQLLKGIGQGQTQDTGPYGLGGYNADFSGLVPDPGYRPTEDWLNAQENF